VDLIDEWAQAQARVIELVAPLTTEQAAVRVPACPDWTVRDLFSHMVGLGADVVAGNEPDDHNPVWTEMQVATRRDHVRAEPHHVREEVADGPVRAGGYPAGRLLGGQRGDQRDHAGLGLCPLVDEIHGNILHRWAPRSSRWTPFRSAAA